jgi:hypothetical protein
LASGPRGHYAISYSFNSNEAPALPAAGLTAADLTRK